MGLLFVIEDNDSEVGLLLHARMVANGVQLVDQVVVHLACHVAI
jgi:hypothetical protein